MSNYLYVGMPIYHKTNSTRGIIAKINGNKITIDLEKPIMFKSSLDLPISHIGEWLFYNKEDINLDPEYILALPQYSSFGNKRLVEIHKQNIEKEKQRIAGEKKLASEKEKLARIALERIEMLAKLAKEEEEKLARIEQKKKETKEAKENLLIKLQSQHGFEGFHHYTDMLNFIKIMDTGMLLSRTKADKIGFVDAAEQSVLSGTIPYIKDSVRFYYKEKTPTIYVNEGIKRDNAAPHMPIPVLLIFNEDIIYNSDVIFLSGGGGNNTTRKARDPLVADVYDWDVIFSRGAIPNIEGVFDGERGNCDSSIKNKRNAEFLYPNEIEIKHIKKIIFRAESDKKVAVTLLGENSLYEVDTEKLKFNYSHNFLTDYEIILDDQSILFALDFKQHPIGYENKVIIKYSDYTEEALDLDNIPEGKLIKKIAPRGYEHHYYYLNICTEPSKIVMKAEYLMNGHVSAVWEMKKND